MIFHFFAFVFSIFPLSETANAISLAHSKIATPLASRSVQVFPRRGSRAVLRSLRPRQLQTSTLKKPPLLPSAPSKTTIIVAPHPDDEILCCSTRISEKIATGERVKIVFFTDGDARSTENSALSRSYGRTRRSESVRAAKKLGLARNDLFFLGFPDGHLSDLSDEPIRSKFSARTATTARHAFPGTDFTRQNLVEIFKKILDRHPATEIILPSEKDAHPDHRVAGEIAREVAEKSGQFPRILEYIVHDRKIATSAKINQKKLELIRIFQSQFHDEFHKKFLENFAKIPEVFDSVARGIARE